MHDAMAGLRRTLAGGAKWSMAVLSGLLVIVGLQRRALDVLRRLARMFSGHRRKTARIRSVGKPEE